MIEKKIHYSNCNLVDPVTGTGTRVSVKTNDSGEQVRISTKSGSTIPWPDKKWSFRKREAIDGPKDTPPELALEKTYDYQQDVAAMKLVRQTMKKYNYDFH